MSTMPEFYKENVNTFIGLGPFARRAQAYYAMADLGSIGPQLFVLADILDIHEIGLSPTVQVLLGNFCGYFTNVCKFVTHFIATDDTEQIDLDSFRVMWGHYPAPTSAKAFQHLN